MRYNSMNADDDEDEKEREVQIYVPPKITHTGIVLAITDMILTIVVLFAAVKFSTRRVLKQFNDFHFSTSSADMVVLCAIRAILLLLSAWKSKAARVKVTRNGHLVGSTTSRLGMTVVLASVGYAIIKVGVSISKSHVNAGGWAVAAVSLSFAVCEALSLSKMRGAVSTITRNSLYEKLNQNSTEDNLDAMEGNESPFQKSLSPMEMFIVLKPYFWPKGGSRKAVMNRVRSTATWMFVILSKVCSVTSPFYLSYATNDLYSGDVKGASINVTYYALLSFAAKTLKECQNLVYLRVKQQAYVEVAEHTFAHVHQLSLQWHLKKRMGNVIRSMDRGTDAANNLVSYLFLYLVPAVAECVVVVAIFYIKFSDWKLATMAFVSLLLYAYVTIKITLWRKKFRAATNKHDNDFHDKATDSIINYETVKYFTNEEYEVDRFRESVVQFQHFSTSTQASLSVLNTLQQLILMGTLIGGLIFAAQSVKSGQYSVGDFVSVNTYMVNLFTPLNFLGTVYNIIIQSFVDIRNLSELLAESPDIVDHPGAPDLSLVSSNGIGVEFRDIWFRYPSQSPTQGLKGVSITVPPGTTTAIVGHTGAGKTTISRLLFRFYDPLQGGVYINGQNIKSVRQQSVRRAIGVVPQDTVMFNETILHNIKYGKIDATMEEVEAACKSAQIYDFIMSLPDKWNSLTGERGLKLSGGEKQRVAIARCLLKNPPIVLLDEATSALDTRTEKGVQMALNSLAKHRTTIVVAHRLSTIRNANQIVVLSDGQVVERGTHDELLSKRGEYHSLWNMQLHEQEEEEKRRKTMDEDGQPTVIASDGMDGVNGAGAMGMEEGKEGNDSNGGGAVANVAGAAKGGGEKRGSENGGVKSKT